MTATLLQRLLGRARRDRRDLPVAAQTGGSLDLAGSSSAPSGGEH
jgi:hypothetical protein